MNEFNKPNINENDHLKCPNHNREPKKRGCLIIFIIIILIGIFTAVVLVFIVFSLLFSTILTNDSSSNKHQLKQIYKSGNIHSNNKIALIYIKGIIQNSDTTWNKAANINDISQQLEESENDPDIKAIILYINTPGGEITATDILHHNIEKVKLKKPVIAIMDSIATSGGYYVAVASDYIIANRLTITGSIGVIINSYNIYDLLKKVGINDEVYKSKKMKDILNPARPRTKEEKTIIQALISESYLEFVKIVSQGRIDKAPKLTVKYIQNSIIGDGRIFSGAQAYKLGLIDELGYFQNAVDKAIDLAKLSKNDYKLISYKKQLSFSDILQKFTSNINKINVEIPIIKQYSKIESGKLYYIYLGN